jgi:predicted nucleotidyltransferase
MINTLPTLTTRPDRPVDPLLLDILREVDVVTKELGIEYFVGGAMARDLILLHVFGRDTGRATRDVDLGICIDHWGKLDSLKQSLIKGGNFTELAKVAHRLIYRPNNSANGTPLDLLPFGKVESANATIAWPPDMDVIMNVAGFAEARESALNVQVAPEFSVLVTSLPSLAVLKILAWRDRHLATTKDAIDFMLIARHYHDAGNTNRLYESESALLQAAEFDPGIAGAMLLGKDAAAVCQARTAQAVQLILADPQMQQRLVDQLLRATLSSGEEVGASMAERYIKAFHIGFGST